MTIARPQKPDAITLLAALKPAPAVPAPAIVGDKTPAGNKMRKPKPGARAGTRLIAGHFPPSTLIALKHVMAEEETTLQALLDEAIHDLLVKKGRLKLKTAYTSRDTLPPVRPPYKYRPIQVRQTWLPSNTLRTCSARNPTVVFYPELL